MCRTWCGGMEVGGKRLLAIVLGTFLSAGIASLCAVCLVLACVRALAAIEDAPSEARRVDWRPETIAEQCQLAFSAELAALYGSAPEPWWFFPLVLSDPEQVGLVIPDGDIRICESVLRSSWTERSLWLRVVVKPLNQDRFVEGWVTVGPMDLNSFARSPTVSGNQP